MAVNPWTSAQVARDDLRRYVNDGAQDRPIKQKLVFGAVNGQNTKFTTFDDRLVASSFVATVDFVPVTATLDDPVMGDFTLASAPLNGSQVRAKYFFQYFLDSDLDEALQMAAIECIESDDITQVTFGLKPAALNFGGHFAYTKMAIRWAQRMSSKFLLEEEPTQEDLQQRPAHFLKIAGDMYKHAVLMRDAFYMRNGRRNAPAVAVNKPRLRAIAPRR